MQKLLSIDEVAEHLRLKKPTIYQYVSLKKIPYIKLGNRVFFNPAKIDDWVEKKSVEAVK